MARAEVFVPSLLSLSFVFAFVFCLWFCHCMCSLSLVVPLSFVFSLYSFSLSLPSCIFSLFFLSVFAFVLVFVCVCVFILFIFSWVCFLPSSFFFHGSVSSLPSPIGSFLAPQALRKERIGCTKAFKRRSPRAHFHTPETIQKTLCGQPKHTFSF